mmetsp:Transcript_12114/g.21880  ORF Transcript_12114/g.21880 Transcript_12114/m.21880 type:complete len:109 (-) Transcript_12114:222-548(-)
MYTENTTKAGRKPGSGSFHRLVKSGWRRHASCPWNGMLLFYSFILFGGGERRLGDASRMCVRVEIQQDGISIHRHRIQRVCDRNREVSGEGETSYIPTRKRKRRVFGC